MELLTRGMDEWLTYRIPAFYHVVLVERLGGLFFDGWCSCARDSFARHLGLYCGEYTCLSRRGIDKFLKRFLETGSIA